MNPLDVLKLKPEDFQDREVSAEEMLEWLGACDACWVHSGRAGDPHALLTKGGHSNGFFNCLQVLKYVNLSEILANQLARRIREIIGDQRVGWVIASPMAGITFGHDVARALGASVFMFTEKGPNKTMLFNRMMIPKGVRVLQIEELITTSGTLNTVKQAVDEAHSPYSINWIPVIGAVVHRPPQLPITHYGGRQVVSLIEQKVEVWTEESCPLCAGGSVALPAKTHWADLTGEA